MMPYPSLKATQHIIVEKEEYNHHDFYLLRVPYYPIDYLKQLHTLRGAGNNKQTLFSSPDFMEALFLGSFDLYVQYTRYLEGDEFTERISNKLLHAIEKYFIRMCSRCTPYGLFAGYTSGHFGPETAISLKKREKYKKHVRLDMHYLAGLADQLAAFPEIKDKILYYPNNSLYKAGNKIRYVESVVVEKARSYRLSSVDGSKYVDLVLAHAQKGACRKQLIACLAEEGIDEEDANTFLDALIANQLLVNELGPTLSGGDVLSDFLSRLSFLPESTMVKENMHAVAALLKNPEPGVQYYEKIAAYLKPIHPDTTLKNLAHADLELSAVNAVLSEGVVREIQHHLSQLQPLFLLRENDHLKKWQVAFYEKYEDAEIPLVIALDPELGIGHDDYGEGNLQDTPLIEHLILGDKEPAQEIAWSRMLKWKNQKLKEALAHKKDFIITEEDIATKGFSHLSLNSAESIYVMGSILAGSRQDVDTGNYIFSLDTCFGPSSVNLLSRFTNGDSYLINKLKECVAAEEAQHPEKAYAEIVHLPESRAGNLLLRPAFRQYEIAYLAKPAAGSENQVDVSDLMVRCTGGKIILRSKKLNKEVVPRLSTSHNFTNSSLPVYKFLCDLQIQEVNIAIVWDWEIFTEDIYLPRVVYKNILLCPAIWNIALEDLPFLNDPKLKDGAIPKEHLFNLYDRVRKQLNIPSLISIIDHDQKLFINFEDESYVRLFHNHFQKNKRLRLQEFLFTEKNCFITGEGGKYANEVIIPYTKKPAGETVKSVKAHPPGPPPGTIKREFAVGSEWLYLKIYTRNSTAEKLLKEDIKRLIEKLQEKGLIEKWFFIRYNDPKFHLRVRFYHSSDKKVWKKTIENITAAIGGHLDSGLIEKIQFDTYVREVARYGHDNMALSESLFHADSDAIIRVIDLLGGADSETFRWLLALRNIDMLLSDFQFDLEGKFGLLKILKTDYLKEFDADKAGLSQLDLLYRTERERIHSILNDQEDKQNEIQHFVSVFQQRSDRNRSIITQLARTAGGHEFLLKDLAASHIHMSLNRMLVSNQRKQELVLYYLMTKYYESRLGFIKHAN
jgi:thiopeptide-type bacteriocin biosynthesis protein